MAIKELIQVTAADIQHIGSVLEGLESINDSTMSQMRAAYPHLSFSLCSEDDTGERTPYAVFGGFDIHLLAANPHGCSALTNEIDSCNGLVVALHEAE